LLKTSQKKILAEHNLLEGVNLALKRSMQDDPKVIVFGEDVGVVGGVFRATQGLLQSYGPQRVFDMPLSETLIAGMAIGLAAQGFRPVAEIQFMGFIHATMDQMVNHAARMRSRTRGRLSCPMVLRAPFGGGIHAPEHHSESTEAMFAHIPGLRVVIPSSPQRAYGLLLGSIRDPDPVVFLEPKRLYRSTKEQFDDDGQALALDQCHVLREGDDLTLITWGAMTIETIFAADALAVEGVEVTVIDVATLKPLDIETILNSLQRTGRAVIVHEAARTAGFGAEIAARIAAEGLFHLQAPVLRVTGYDTVMPLPRLEHLYMPTVARIIDAARSTLAYA
jgi:pyruvate dehydrogenase E1 component beta subunit